MSVSNVAFPRELSKEVSYQVPPDVQSYTVRVAPSNVQQVQSTTQTLTASSTLQLLGNSQNVNFDIPAGQSKSVFIDPRFSTLTFRVNYEVVSAGSSAVVTNALLRSNAMAHFDRMFIESQSGVLLDDVNNIGLVSDTDLQLSVDVAQRDGYALMYGLRNEGATANSLNSNQGHNIVGVDNTTVTAGNNYYSYSVPLLNSLIGVHANKMFQIGATNRLRLTLVTAANLPITMVTSTATTAATFRVTIDNIALNLQYIDVGMEGLKMLGKTGGVQYYNGITNRVSSTTVPASTSGTLSLLSGLKGSSVRSIITRFNETALSTAGSVNGIYDSKMPQATSINYNINGLRVPSNPTDLLRNPAYAFSCLQHANANFKNGEFRSGIVPSQYAIYIAGGSLPSDTDRVVSGAGTSSSALNLASFMFGENLEKIAKEGILSGMNLNAGQTFLEMNISNPNTNAYTCYFIARQDIIYIHDLDSGEISVRL